MQIVTNNQERLFLYRYEVPESVLLDQFGHLNNEEHEDGYIKYRGSYYHLSDFMRIEKHSQGHLWEDWDAYTTETAFSGLLLKIPKFKTETYIIGRYWV